MSTDTGEDGFCDYCGHPMSSHTHELESGCGNCGKKFIICQAGIHGVMQGWAICHRPCDCGPQYLPDRIRSAKDLEYEDFAGTHPIFAGTAEAGGATESHPTASTSDVWVTIEQRTVAGGTAYIWYQRAPGEVLESTREDDWGTGFTDYNGTMLPSFKLVRDGMIFRTWTLDPASISVDLDSRSHEQDEKGKGRTKPYHHERSWSQESDDPITGQAFNDSLLVEKMAAFKLLDAEELQLAQGASASASRIRVTLRRRGDVRLVFRDPSTARDVPTRPESWNAVSDGFEFQSIKLGRTFFAVALPTRKGKR